VFGGRRGIQPDPTVEMWEWMECDEADIMRLVLVGRPSVLEEVRKFRERHHKLIRYIPFDAQILLEAPGLDPSSPSRITCVRRVACRGSKRRPRNGRREG